MNPASDYVRLLGTSSSVETLVKAGRYASEKYIEPLTSLFSDQARHQAVFDAAVARVEELGHLELADLLRAEHRIRLRFLAARTATDREANRVTDPYEDED